MAHFVRRQHLHPVVIRGGGYGVHVVATGTRWNEVRIAQQGFFGTRLELRLSEPAESSHGRKTAAKVPEDRPGRGLNHDQLLGQIALPRLDGQADAATLNAGVRDAVERLTEVSPERTPRRVRLLPSLLRPEDVPAPARQGVVPFGLLERDLSATMLDLTGQDRHLLILGDEQAGKTSALRHIMLTLVEQHTEDEIVFAVYDPRKGLRGVIPDSHLGGYAPSAALAQGLTSSVVQELRTRVPQDPLAPAPETFQGPRIVLIVDDYDVLTAGGSSPMREFAEFLPMGAEIGLHAFVSRKVRGASRGLFEPFTGAMREAGGATFIMDRDRSEGTLVNGVRPRRRRRGPDQSVHAPGGDSPGLYGDRRGDHLHLPVRLSGSAVQRIGLSRAAFSAAPC
ncbi:FtsK/SpoIIIE domain-containing protein [Nesterenkonia sp. K-15-9-6]|uniref:FtsK/SpoIIIE domain-containing protein n=1 Tax=Nesterenkonia sp. K-15-9-6 TaxID=3093918 RepID=UPI004043C3F0